MPDTDIEQELCKSCGLCCDVTLFPHAKVEADEPLLPGQEEIHKDGKRLFKLPCPYFDGCCTVYHKQRPSVCGAFKCTLLEGLIKEEIGFAEATQLVAKIKAQKMRLTRLLSAYPGATLSERYKEFCRLNADQKDTAVFRLHNKDLLTEWVLFRARLGRLDAE